MSDETFGVIEGVERPDCLHCRLLRAIGALGAERSVTSNEIIHACAQVIAQTIAAAPQPEWKAEALRRAHEAIGDYVAAIAAPSGGAGHPPSPRRGGLH